VAVALAALAAGPALTTSPASAAASGLPVVRLAWEQADYWGFRVQAMRVRLHIDNASGAKILRMDGYNTVNNPNAPLYDWRWRLTVTAGPLTLKHTGPGNLWKGSSHNHKLIEAVAAGKTVMTVRACNGSGCVTQPFTLSRVP
jgi:hypothetical protein